MGTLSKSQNLIRKAGLFFANPHILFYSLPWLMFLVVMGTVSQKELGLYDATHIYFNSIILWIGPIPTPGGLSTIGIIFVALTIKFIFYSPWNKKKAGTILTHLGVLLLLLGGIITATISKEGFMIIPEGRNVGSVSDYFEREVRFQQNGKTIKSVAFDTLKQNQTIEIDAITITVLMRCDNCSARAPSGIYKDLQGLAVNMELFPVKSEKQKEANFSAMALQIENHKNSEESGTYIVMEGIPKNPILNGIEIILERKTTTLPFSITLEDFRKIDYPGTSKAREYESSLVIRDGKISWPAIISMNKPLRYKGYTFYQSSFEQRPETEVTVLSVVENKGRAFPYIATLVIFLGLLVHLILHLQKNRRRHA